MRTDAAVVRAAVPGTNGLLAELAVHERNAIQRASQLQFHAAGDILLQAGAPSRWVFFPVDAVVSVVRRLRDERAVGIGLFGSEGVAGIDVALATKSQLDDIVVQSAGSFYCMASDDLLHQFQGTLRLQKAIFRFLHGFLGQVGRNTLCNRYHSLQQRLARWLLMIDDRAGSIEGTQSRRLLAMALGADEPEIAEALTTLASASAIRDRRSAIMIRRDALEVGACECYDAAD